MTPRRPTILAGAALAATLAWVVPTSADSLATYSLTNSNDPGTAPVTQIIAEISPIGAFDILSSKPPLTPVSGYEQYNLVDSYGLGTIPDGFQGAGQPVQALQLDLKGAALEPGDTLRFALRLDPAYQGAVPALTPRYMKLQGSGDAVAASGLAIPQGVISTPADPVEEPNPPAQGGGGAGDPLNVPEPLSLLVWSALASLGLIRARSRRCAGGR